GLEVPCRGHSLYLILHCRRNSARADGVHIDTVDTQGGGQGLTQVYDGRLGGAVRWSKVHGLPSAYRSDIDYLAASPRPEMRDHGAHHSPHTREIAVQASVEAFLAQIQTELGLKYAGVVDQYVEPAEMRNGVRHATPDGPGVRYIKLQPDGLPAHLPQLSRRRVRSLQVAIGDDDPAACARQLHCDPQADSLGAAGHKRSA